MSPGLTTTVSFLVYKTPNDNSAHISLDFLWIKFLGSWDKRQPACNILFQPIYFSVAYRSTILVLVILHLLINLFLYTCYFNIILMQTLWIFIWVTFIMPCEFICNKPAIYMPDRYCNTAWKFSHFFRGRVNSYKGVIL